MHRPATFISYSHDSPAQAERVRALGASLARDGCDCRLDVHKDGGEDWPAWMTRQLIEADRVLCVVTETGTPPDLPTRATAPLFARPGEPASRELPAGAPPSPAPPERIARSRLLDAVPPAEPRPVGASPALRIWQKKLEFLLVEEAKAAEAAARFKLREDIEEARQKIAELGGEP